MTQVSLTCVLVHDELLPSRYNWTGLKYHCCYLLFTAPAKILYPCCWAGAAHGALLITFSTNRAVLGQNPKKRWMGKVRVTEAHGEGSDIPPCFWGGRHECQQRCCNVLNCGSGVCRGKQKPSFALMGIKLLICPRRTWYPAKPYPNTASGTTSGLYTRLQ